MKIKTSSGVLSFISAAVLVACAPPPGVQTGGSQSLVSGSAGGGTSVNANKSLERCAQPLGTLAVSDGRFTGSQSVTTVDPLIRLAVQQSNCFVITGIGNSATSALLDRITDQQRNSGEYRAGSKQQKGQRVAADYLLDPQIIVNNEATSGQSGSLGGALLDIGLGAAGLSGVSAAAARVSGSVESRVSDVALTLTDIRSTVQVAISQGSATANNLSASGSGAFGGWGNLFAGSIGASLGTYSRTPEGIAIAAAFFDAYNSMVIALRNYKAQEVRGGSGQGGLLQVK